MISKIKAVNIVHNVIAEHFGRVPDPCGKCRLYESLLDEGEEAFSKWDAELLTINKEICNRIRKDGNEKEA